MSEEVTVAAKEPRSGETDPGMGQSGLFVVSVTAGVTVFEAADSEASMKSRLCDPQERPSVQFPDEAKDPAPGSLGPMNQSGQGLRGWRRLGAACAALLMIWGVVLPAVGQLPLVSEHVDWLEQQQIDPSAMYYTELDSFKPVLQRINDRLRIHGPRRD